MYFILPALMLIAVFTAGRAQAVSPCGSLDNGFGPFDYRTASQFTRYRVEHYHFTEQVATLTHGQSGESIGGDIAYTLRAFPNHIRALMAMAELARRQKRDPPTGSPYTVECWFQRAEEFRPDDGQVYLAYGVALLQRGKQSAAIAQLEKALELLPNDANAEYNLGLAYFDRKEYDKALAHAKKAYALGFPLPGLREMLKREGQWR